MRDALLLIGAALCNIAGFSLLALAMRAHWLDAIGMRAADQAAQMGPRAPLRLFGAGALIASLMLAVVGNGMSFGIVLWVLLLSVGAFFVTGILAWRPVWLRPLAKLVRRKGG